MTYFFHDSNKGQLDDILSRSNLTESAKTEIKNRLENLELISYISYIDKDTIPSKTNEENIIEFFDYFKSHVSNTSLQNEMGELLIKNFKKTIFYPYFNFDSFKKLYKIFNNDHECDKICTYRLFYFRVLNSNNFENFQYDGYWTLKDKEKVKTIVIEVAEDARKYIKNFRSDSNDKQMSTASNSNETNPLTISFAIFLLIAVLVFFSFISKSKSNKKTKSNKKSV